MFYVPSFTDSKKEENKETHQKKCKKEKKEENQRGVPPQTAQKLILDLRA